MRASASTTSMTYAHELNHNLDQAATSTWGLHSRGCNAQSGGALDPSWPYGNRFNIIETGVAPNALPFTSVSPSTPDFMSYCGGSGSPRSWWSPYRWEAWLDEFRSTQNKMAGASGHKGQVPEDSFYVQFRVYPDGSGELTQIMRQPGIPDPAGTGAYQLTVKDCSGAVLHSAGFNASFVGDEGEDQEFVALAAVVPAPMEACGFELSLDASVLDSRLISPAVPVATLISPNGGETFSGIETVQWSGSDADADDLTYALLYSADGGTTWQAVASAIEDTQLNVDFSELPGSVDARMRVLVTDGANTSMDDSDAAFEVIHAPPVVEITAPSDGESIAVDAPVRLRGVARAAGLAVAPEQLTWLVDGSPAGTGETLTVYLPAGEHEITLQAAPAGVPQATATISVLAGGTTSIGFETALVEVDEDEGEAVLNVQRTGAAATSAAVSYFTSDGTATGGATGEGDFVAVPQADDVRLEWSENDAGLRAITITLNEDSLPEGAETFTVNLQPVDGEALNVQSATVRIRANDPGLVFADGFED